MRQTGNLEPRFKPDVPPLLENSNTVSMTVSVASPMTAADHVVSIYVFNEKNQQAPELVELALYLKSRARGMPIEAPAVRP